MIRLEAIEFCFMYLFLPKKLISALWLFNNNNKRQQKSSIVIDEELHLFGWDEFIIEFSASLTIDRFEMTIRANAYKLGEETHFSLLLILSLIEH